MAGSVAPVPTVRWGADNRYRRRQRGPPGRALVAADLEGERRAVRIADVDPQPILDVDDRDTAVVDIKAVEAAVVDGDPSALVDIARSGGCARSGGGRRGRRREGHARSLHRCPARRCVRIPHTARSAQAGLVASSGPTVTAAARLMRWVFRRAPGHPTSRQARAAAKNAASSKGRKQWAANQRVAQYLSASTRNCGVAQAAYALHLAAGGGDVLDEITDVLEGPPTLGQDVGRYREVVNLPIPQM